MTHPRPPLPLGSHVELIATIADLSAERVAPGARGQIVEHDPARPAWYRVVFDEQSEGVLVHQSWIRPLEI